MVTDRMSEPAPSAEQADRIEASARKMLMRKLELREHTNSELLRYLTSHGVPAQVADRLLHRFRVIGLVDDARFARAWVECRSSNGSRSSKALRAELRARGIPTDVVEEALQSYTPRKELDAARLFAARKYRSAGGRDRTHILRSVSDALGRRGYPSSVCHQVAKETVQRLSEAMQCDEDECPRALASLNDFTAGRGTA